MASLKETSCEGHWPAQAASEGSVANGLASASHVSDDTRHPGTPGAENSRPEERDTAGASSSGHQASIMGPNVKLKIDTSANSDPRVSGKVC